MSPFAGKTQICFHIELEWVCSWLRCLSQCSECQLSWHFWHISWQHMRSAHNWCHGSSEECINDLKAPACLEEAVPIEWFHHGSIKDPDFLIHRLEHVKAAVAWAYGKRKLNCCRMMAAARLSAHEGPCWKWRESSTNESRESRLKGMPGFMACSAKGDVIRAFLLVRKIIKKY